MKRPILGLLAAAILSLGPLGSSPARAATSYSPTAAMVTPDSSGYEQSGARPLDDDDDDDDDGDRKRRCSGLIVIFCT